MSSNISGLSLTLAFILSFMATMMALALSSAPCLALFSAAPEGDGEGGEGLVRPGHITLTNTNAVDTAF